MASTLPSADTRGSHGLTASSAAVASSRTPSSAENVVTEKMSYIQLIRGLFATRDSIPWASYEVNFMAPIQAITTTRP